MDGGLRHKQDQKVALLPTKPLRCWPLPLTVVTSVMQADPSRPCYGQPFMAGAMVGTPWFMEDETKAQRDLATSSGHTTWKVGLQEPHVGSALRDPRCGRVVRLQSRAPWVAIIRDTFQTGIGNPERRKGQ